MAGRRNEYLGLHHRSPAIADEIEAMDRPRVGFGSVRVRVRIGDTAWGTSLFPDTKARSYVLPVKRSVREREDLGIGDSAVLHISVVPE
ncbi:MAG: DUF1905 domain-containing protein [Actinomycetia bacterium]|nr:DUF1905 domain-containing protein [Actinomycetes bacterium]